ncbi:MAG: RcnB family protein [Proteobacteria bacterium]|nr:RcnB family protein [Pseudomonadota bacterium]
MRSGPRKSAAATLAAIVLASTLSACVVAPPAAPSGTVLVPGATLPPRYQGDAYVVSDWQARGLYAPPPDYGWRYVDGQYVLVTITTGIVAATFLGALFGHGGHGAPGFGPR